MTDDDRPTILMHTYGDWADKSPDVQTTDMQGRLMRFVQAGDEDAIPDDPEGTRTLLRALRAQIVCQQQWRSTCEAALRQLSGDLHTRGQSASPAAHMPGDAQYVAAAQFDIGRLSAFNESAQAVQDVLNMAFWESEVSG